MKAYLTSGTLDYLLHVTNDHPSIHAFFMGEESNTVVYYESENASIFETPRAFDVIISKRHIQEHGFIIMNHIPVTDEGKPIFESQFKQRAVFIEETPGFQALRVLRPLRGNTYIVMIQWQDQDSYKNWKESESFKKAHTNKGKKKRPPYTAGPSYVSSYPMIDLEELSES